MVITEEYLKEHPDHIFIFGDNCDRVGNSGAAKLRHLPNTYGFITKKGTDHNDCDYYRMDEYLDVLYAEVDKLKKVARENPDKTYLMSKIGSGVANKYCIFEYIIEPIIKKIFEDYGNIVFLW